MLLLGIIAVWGIVACLWFTDIEDSSGLWERHPQGMRTAIGQHHEVVRGSVNASGGRVVKDTGDGFLAEFDSPQDALAAALDAQRNLGAIDWQGVGTAPVLEACTNSLEEPELDELLSQGAQLELDAAVDLALDITSLDETGPPTG